MSDAFGGLNRRKLRLRAGKERVVANRHPWIFAGAIAKESGPEDAAIADLVDDRGAVIASGFYSPHSQIRMRALTFGEPISEATIRQRIQKAVERRGRVEDRRPRLSDEVSRADGQAGAPVLHGETNAMRVVNAEGDELSGLIVDRYNDVLVVEISNAGVERIKPLVIETLRETLRPRGILFRNDLSVRTLEKLTAESEWIGDGEPATEVRENGLRFAVDPREGQKTGFFLDQRANRALARELAPSRRVLNLFSYSGAFGVYAAAGGATDVENVDISAPAIELARRNHELNGSAAQFTVADCFKYVREQAAARTRWDVVICDPPAFAKSRGEVDRAARGYKDINLYSLKLVEAGGFLMTFSCSGHMSVDLFQKVVFSAALDAGRKVSFVRRLTAGEDHPVSLYCPEGEYLKGFLLQVHD